MRQNVEAQCPPIRHVSPHGLKPRAENAHKGRVVGEIAAERETEHHSFVLESAEGDGEGDVEGKGGGALLERGCR